MSIVRQLIAGFSALGLFAVAVLVASEGVKSVDPQAAKIVPAPHATSVDFNRDVRPILADRCFRCHGPDAAPRKRGLRLDTQEGSRATLRDGLRAIVPGDLEASEAWKRIASDDLDEAMPPPSLNRALTDAQKSTLRAWIEQGAEYAPHWAFVVPKPEVPPNVRDERWNAEPIDRFVFTRLASEGLAPNPRADPATLLRRVSLALTGLPPTPEETRAFAADASPGAYEKQVDRLLASPRFGERLAVDWLDVARYADTFGYQSDWDCETWPWRDWVIAAFNRDLPYDEFVREQLAGDLMPGATREQKLATAFNRLHRQTNEGGSIDEEFRREYVSDRIATASTAFLGLTVECARCHDHKYDPIPQRDYYSLGAFFGAIDESGTYSYSHRATSPPTLRLPTPEQEAELARLEKALAQAEADHAATLRDRHVAFVEWSSLPHAIEIAPPIKHIDFDGGIDGPKGKATALDGDSGPAFADVPAFRRCDPYSLVFWMRCPDVKQRATVLHTAPFTIESDQQGYQVMLEDGRLEWQVIHLWPGSAAAIRTREAFPIGQWVQLAVTYDGSSRAAGLRIYLDGVEANTEILRDHLDGVATSRIFQVGFRDRDLGFKGGAVDDLSIFDRALSAPEIRELNAAGSGAPSSDGLEDFFTRNVDDACRASAKRLRDARAAHQDLLDGTREIMVMEETRYPRDFFVLERGAYDQPDRTREVHADRAIDAILPFDPAWPKNRLGLASWMTDAKNPLVARVEVNRLWAQCFGRGLVLTQENYGLQGESPSHPELLDTLAADFVKGGWKVKAMLKRIVLSSTFCQASAATDEKREKDPANALLSRGPAIRASAEMLRDNALAASGLLFEKVGGPSAKPWQPAGLWEDAGATGSYTPDTGPDAHRRSLYTFKKRTAPPPNMLLFDSGSGEKCLARRQPTNTPLQQLALLDDPVFFECARLLAARVNGEGSDVDARIARAFALLTAREPREAEATVLRALFDEQLAAFSIDADAAKAVTASEIADPALAALTLVCSTLIASDAVVTIR
ncbi:MAG TPA: DUF1549 domain-containing protein [Planctomycetota bacterium]|nr:DUF1549 domain-containing protein [Planctomycetota bacterium]